MKLVTFQNHDGRVVAVNPYHVTAIRPNIDGTETEIHVIGVLQAFVVTNNFDSVIQRLIDASET